jgi:hypothetical protein
LPLFADACLRSVPGAYTSSGVSALFQQYINAKTNAYFAQDLSNQVNNYTQVTVSPVLRVSIS